MVFNTTFNNIWVISCQSVLLVKETGVPGKNHRPATSHWQTLSHNVVSRTPRLCGIRSHKLSGVRHWLHIGSCKSNYHTITTTMSPRNYIIRASTAQVGGEGVDRNTWLKKLTHGWWASDCCLTSMQQFFSYIMVRTSYFSMMMRFALYYTNMLSRILIVLGHWNNRVRIDVSPQSDTLSLFRANQSLLFLLNAACLTEK